VHFLTARGHFLIACVHFVTGRGQLGSYDACMVKRRSFAGALVLATVLLAGCSGGGGAAAPASAPLPDAATLVAASAKSVGAITTTHLTLAVTGTIPGLSVQSVDGDLTKAGQAKGTGKISMGGQLIEVEFVLTGGSLYLKGPTGGFQKLPASLGASLYDPSAILDPNRGIAKVLSSMGNPKSEATEDVNGTSTVKVTGKVADNALSGLLPGVTSGGDATFWLTKDGQHLPVKASITFPGNARADVTLSDVDKPVTVTAPA
jgi:lipoprotein LprG